MKYLIFALSVFLPVAGWTSTLPVSNHTAAVSPELLEFIGEYGAGLGLGINAQTRIFLLSSGYNKKPEATNLPPCLIPSLEDFVRKLPKGNTNLGMAMVVRDYLSAATRSRDLDRYLSGSGTANLRLNKNGLRLLSGLLLNKENCGKTAPEDLNAGGFRDIKISPDTAGMPAEASGTRSLRDLNAVLSAPVTAFDGGSKNTGEVLPAGKPGETAHYQMRGASGEPRLQAAAGSGRQLKVMPPLPEAEQPRRVRSRFTDVRRARQRWKERDIPVVSGVMDFFAGMVQFAQDDGDTIRYEGITSPKGRKAALDLSVNSLWLLMSVPSVSNVVTGAVANVASGIFSGGSAVAGNYRFLARFQATPGVSYTEAEPVWLGIERIAKGAGAGKGIIHVGFAKFQAGAHLGLNFLGETHIYFSHIYIRALNVTVPNEVIRELWRYYSTKSDTGKAPSSAR